MTRGTGTPWLANARATLRTVRGEVAQDPVQFALQLQGFLFGGADNRHDAREDLAEV